MFMNFMIVDFAWLARFRKTAQYHIRIVTFALCHPGQLSRKAWLKLAAPIVVGFILHSRRIHQARISSMFILKIAAW
jgi:hypothetical protein